MLLSDLCLQYNAYNKNTYYRKKIPQLKKENLWSSGVWSVRQGIVPYFDFLALYVKQVHAFKKNWWSTYRYP